MAFDTVLGQYHEPLDEVIERLDIEPLDQHRDPVKGSIEGVYPPDLLSLIDRRCYLLCRVVQGHRTDIAIAMAMKRTDQLLIAAIIPNRLARRLDAGAKRRIANMNIRP